jgi:type IV pilus assembly protein PilA
MKMASHITLRTRTRSAAGGFTLIEVIFVTAVIALVSAIAVPTVFRSKLAANETSAVGTMRTIHTAQLTFTLTCGYGLYASSFTDLVDPTGENFLTEDLTYSPTPQKSGFDYTMQPGPSGPSGLVDCNGGSTATEYYVSATPSAVGGTANRAFATNQNSVIWQDVTGVAPLEPFVAGPTTQPIE